MEDVCCSLWSVSFFAFNWVIASQKVSQLSISGVLNLRGSVPEPVIEYLRTLPRLESRAAVTQYIDYCEKISTQNKKVQGAVHVLFLVSITHLWLLLDWFGHKKRYPWLVPSLNRHMTKMPRDHWDQVPNNTNPMEGSHATDNRKFSVNHSLLEAILLWVTLWLLHFQIITVSHKRKTNWWTDRASTRCS